MIPLLSVSAAAAEVWFVPDEQLAGALREAVRDEWPEVEHEVRVGTAPADLEAWTWDGATLSLRADEEREGEAGDPHVAALLARTWVIRADRPGFERWAPPPAATLSVARVEPPTPTASTAPDWSLVLSAGTRTATGEPGLVQGARFSQAATLDAFLWTADVYVATFPWDRLTWDGPFSSPDRLEDVRVDRTTLGTSVGLRSTGPVFAQATVGLERRTVDHVLNRAGVSRGVFHSNDLAVPFRVGLGARSGRLLPLMSTWARVTPGLPFTAGAELDLGLEWARDRRAARVGEPGAEG